MINIKNVNKYCCEDIRLIENYDKAINDDTQTWDCHHKLGIELNLSKQQLKNNGLYYNRPASELIFLTLFEHNSIHNKGERNAMYGKNPEDFMPIETIKERRRKMSESHKGKHLSEEHKQRISSSLVGKHFSEEHKQNLSEAHKGIYPSEETRQKLSEVHRGKRHSEETKQRISVALTGKHPSEETKQRISEAKKGKPSWSKGKQFSEEHKKNISESHKGKHRIYHEDGTYHYEK